MKIFFVYLSLILMSFSAYASGKYDSVIYTNDSELAIDGWDAVSFFNNPTPSEGSDNWKTEYRGAIWLFSSEEYLKLFNNDPQKYAPAYGGYCAWAMSEGKLAPGKPGFWDIIDDRLYMNFSASTRKKFLASKYTMIRDADLQWPEIKKTLNREAELYAAILSNEKNLSMAYSSKRIIIE